MPHRSGVVALALAATAIAAGPEFLRPVDGAIVAPGAFSIAARASDKAQLRVDGKPVASRSPGPGALTATLPLSAGVHKLELTDGAASVSISITAASPASFRPHPPSASCDTCHTVRDSAWALKSDPLGDTCFTCHDAKTFAVAHQHNADVLVECTLCHQPHGSSTAKHLKMKKELACKQCHG